MKAPVNQYYKEGEYSAIIDDVIATWHKDDYLKAVDARKATEQNHTAPEPKQKKAKDREAMWDAFVTWYDDHIHVYFAEENPDETNNGEVDSDDLPIIIPDNIEKKAIATFLPKGYYAEENESIALYVDTFYYDAEGNMKFRLLQRVIDEEADSDIMIDNENDPVTTIYVNGNEGILVEYPDVPGLYYLVWQDSYYQYSLYGSFSSVAELMKIAEGIKTE